MPMENCACCDGSTGQRSLLPGQPPSDCTACNGKGRVWRDDDNIYNDEMDPMG